MTGWQEYDGSGVLQRSASLTYNGAGARITQSITPAGGSAQLTTYAWDYDNRLTSVTLPGSQTHTYAYDYRMRRVTRSEPSANPVAMTFSGGLSVAEFEVTDPQLGTLNAQPTVEYQRGPDMGGGVGGLLYSLRSGTAKFNLSNGRGDVVAQSDTTGDLTWTASYEAYGKRPVETGTNADRQRANTKERIQSVCPFVKNRLHPPASSPSSTHAPGSSQGAAGGAGGALSLHLPRRGPAVCVRGVREGTLPQAHALL